MTDDEIIYLMTESNKEMANAVNVVAAKAAGQLQAVSVVLRALQYLPGFDRDRFIEAVALFQAALEQEGALHDDARPSFNEYLEALCRPL